LLNAGLTWSMYKNVALSVRVNNLTNKQYMLANGFSTLGRNALVSVSWSM
jgi:outer membrane receptor protein involved in Fe transport